MNGENNSGGDVGGVVCRVAGRDWTVRRLTGRVVVQGEELDTFVDQDAHTISVADAGDVDLVLQHACRGLEKAYEMEDAEPVAVKDEPGFSDDIGPAGPLGDSSAPLLPDDPNGGD